MKTKIILLPLPHKFELTYRNQNNETSVHTISAPIEADKEKFTAYSFGKGVRSFKYTGIVEVIEAQ